MVIVQAAHPHPPHMNPFSLQAMHTLTRASHLHSHPPLIHHAKSVFSPKADSATGLSLPTRAAIIFRGGSQMTRKLGPVTYECCLTSQQQNIIDPLRNLGMATDNFLSTYNSSLLPQLIRDTNPKATWLLDKRNNQVHGFMQSLQSLLDYCMEHNVFYDLIVLVRFDTTVKVSLPTFNLEREHFYFLWKELDEQGTEMGWRTKHRVSDIFHVLTGDLLKTSIQGVNKYIHQFPQGLKYAHMHFMYDPMAKIVGKDHVGFMYKGFCWSNSESAPNGFFDFAGRTTAAASRARKQCDAKI
eukprot:CAMPEP_0196572878 /NCGR_PEP_ID=MMETSP1081-20130531/2850_1 /TAXON_ID=36882 /ORGANISM="Pyramimonas amylifera, Strain CCMP720" /LENGTH=297 /DNA_ID=CAMNT_0041890359 /DNA_START=215 /DNA_END=1108 /DNA_ORIENTATION=-